MIHTRHFTSSLAIRDNGDGRTLVGPLLPWGVRARVVDRGRLVTETFERGALAGTDPARVPLTATHPRDAGTLPIGVTLSIEDRADAAWGEWRVSDTMLGNEVLALARDGVPLGLSIGFAEGDQDPSRAGPYRGGQGPGLCGRRGGRRPCRGTRRTAHPGAPDLTAAPWLREASSAA
jgi:phage head maturation protease